jgi:quercetin dioxygenase-like cupin family protein
VGGAGIHHAPGAVLLTDGYATYESYAKKLGLTHAQCWAHSRRGFFEAQAHDPQGVHEALQQIAALYLIEEDIREQKLTGDDKRLHRLTHSKPRVDAFFDWVNRQFAARSAPEHALHRGARVRSRAPVWVGSILTEPDVPMDTNHLEGALRAIPLGRKQREFLLDRTRRPACRYRAKSDHHRPTARNRSVHPPRRTFSSVFVSTRPRALPNSLRGTGSSTSLPTPYARIWTSRDRKERRARHRLPSDVTEETLIMIEQMPRRHWQPLSRQGIVGVTGRVMLNRAGVVIVNLKFAADATIDEHSAPFEIDVICVGGEGFVSVGASSPFRAGERVVWPAGVNHRLWTEGAAMETLMVERNAA